MPPWASRASCVPSSTTRPRSMTMSLSIRAIVDRRCAMAITVLPRISSDKLLLDRRLDLAIKGGGGFVEDQDRRILEDDPSNGDALALPARKFDAALPDLRIIAAPSLPILEAEDELMRMSPSRRRDDLLLGGALARHRRCSRGWSGGGARCPASRRRWLARRLSCVTEAISWPSMRICPSSRSWKRRRMLTRVVLPAPERPTSPIFSPAPTVMSAP